MNIASNIALAILAGSGLVLAQSRPSVDKAQRENRFILEPAAREPAEVSTGAASNIQSMSLLDDRRVLQAGDLVSFRVVEEGGRPSILRIGDSGELDAPLAGRVRAEGKTCKQVAFEIKRSLEKEYYNRATVILGLESASASSIGRIYITGQVLGQGQMDLMSNEPLTVSKAIIRAGGFADFADQRRVRLIRTQPDGSTTTIKVDVKEVLTKGRAEKDVLLKPGDMIVVPERAINF